MPGKEKVGIFGGAFNPIHFGHLRCAEEVMELLGLDRVLFVPSFDPPFKSRELAPYRHRFLMLKKAIRKNPLFSVSDIESKIPGKSYTVHTIETIKKSHKNSRFFFLMGSDTFLDLPNWYRPLDILNMIEIVVVFRPPIDPAAIGRSPYLSHMLIKQLSSLLKKRKISFPLPRFKGKATFIRTSLLDISATEIRRRIRKGMSIKYLLPQEVESYIILNKLFLPERRKER